jgi:hypothetical protein
LPTPALLFYNVYIVKQEPDMPKSTTLAARVDAELDAELTRLASAKKRTKSWLINEALRSYVATERQFIDAVKPENHSWAPKLKSVEGR